MTKRVIAKALIEVERGKAVIIDVRTSTERDIEPSIADLRWSLQEIEAGNLPPLKKDLKLYLHCRSGTRSERAKQLLLESGFTNVTNLGGLVS